MADFEKGNYGTNWYRGGGGYALAVGAALYQQYKEKLEISLLPFSG